MGDLDKFLKFLFDLKQIELKQQEIAAQQMAADQAQGTQHMLLEAQLSSSKQTLEVLKLTKIIAWLTVVMVVIGLTQAILSIIQILIMIQK